MADLVEKVRVVRLYGVLGAKFGRYHELVVSTPAEAIQALCSLVRGFEAFLTQARDRGLVFGVFNGTRNVGTEELRHPAFGSEEIRIAPIMQGSKRAGLLQTIIGVVLLVASIWNPGLLPAAIGMLAGGIAGLLAPQTKGLASQDEVKNRPSYAFNGPVNTSAQGNAIPILYGEMIIGSAVVSAGIYAEDQQ